MAKLYIFGIGGTGSRVLRSFTMMLAAGVKVAVDEVVPVVIDPDQSNADLTRSITLMNDYIQIQRRLSFSSGNGNSFFKTKIEKILNNYTFVFNEQCQPSDGSNAFFPKESIFYDGCWF
jgi:hypothetical protein